MPRGNKQESNALKSLKQKVDRLEASKRLEELEGTIPTDSEPEINMMRVDTQDYDLFGDPIGLITGSRLKDYNDAFQFAKAFIIGKHNRMMGNRYGKHSLLIKKQYFDEKSINPYLISAFPHMIFIRKEGQTLVEYYKIRIEVNDILVLKLLLTRIPTSDGKARHEQIQHAGAKAMGMAWLEDKNPVPPDYIPSYSDKRPQEAGKIKKSVENGFTEVQH